MLNWIDVNDSIPEINIKDSNGRDIRYIVVLDGDVCLRARTDDNEFIWKNITYWQPLPNPPSTMVK